MLLVDGTYLVYKSYYWAKKKIKNHEIDNLSILKKTARNKFMRQLADLIKDYSIDSLFILFDSEKENFREKAYKQYKKNRKSKPEDIIYIKKEIYSFLKRSNVSFQIAKDVEADDLIASFIKQNPRTKIYVYTGDGDLGAVVTPYATLLQEKKDEINEINEGNFLEHFPVMPYQLADYKALAGDKSDNIHKIKGITNEERLQILKGYQNLEDFFENGKSEILYPKMKKEKERILFNKFLVTLKDDCSVKEYFYGHLEHITIPKEIAEKIGWEEIL